MWRLIFHVTLARIAYTSPFRTKVTQAIRRRTHKGRRWSLKWASHCETFGTDLKSAPEHANHEHDYRQVVGEHVPPRLQDPERWLLFSELTEFHHRNHDAWYKRTQNETV